MHTSRARNAAIIGMVGGTVFIIHIFIKYVAELSSLDGGSLGSAIELLSFSGIIAAMAGFLGLLWGHAFRGWLGPIGVIMYVIGWALIIVGGIGFLVMGAAESPLFLVFPIGGNLQTLGYILCGIATVINGRWSGWQRWMPLVVAVVLLLTSDLPMFLGLTPDGPGMIPGLLMGAVWFGVGLAVFTAYQQTKPALSTASSMV